MSNAFRKILAPVLVMLWALLAPPSAALAAEEVDLLLVLASDVSRSVDQPKFQLQREGYAAAVSNPRVLDAIASGPNHRIAICFLEWSGAGNQKLVIDWSSYFRRQFGARFRRPARGSAALLRRSHLDQRRPRIRHGAIRARALLRQAPHH
jgi:hypothetical protein